jgi:hypothetical protein
MTAKELEAIAKLVAKHMQAGTKPQPKKQSKKKPASKKKADSKKRHEGFCAMRTKLGLSKGDTVKNGRMTKAQYDKCNKAGKANC